jgi:hypothetical protein
MAATVTREESFDPADFTGEPRCTAGPAASAAPTAR